jgi:hypothetical protein
LGKIPLGDAVKGMTVYQIWYRDEQRPFLDPLMKSWDNRENLRPEWCEYWIMRQAGQSMERHFDELTGFFSWKFRRKLNLEFSQIEGFIQAYPGYDCYIFNPAVFQGAFFQNVWQQGEAWLPGLTRMAQSLLDALGHCINLTSSVDHHLSVAFANYWIARRPFWRAWLDFMEPVFEQIESEKSVAGSPFWQPCCGSAGGEDHVQALPSIPFLVERLFSAFVKMHPQFRIAAWEFPFDVLQKQAFRAAGLIPIANWYELMYQETREEHYLKHFSQIQAEMLSAVSRSLEEHPGALIS